ncbi:MAG: 2Fe-2S iron-sulfur cluster-binding protein [Tagaea sp.]|nr:2Fe-2S iron-sulfur cluster-binding protein [Tagaea sp.]
MDFHPLAVSDVTRETRDCVAVTFAVPPALAAAYRFRAGQYVTLRRVVDGAELRRNYSICAAPYEGILRVGIKRVAGGAVSSWANDALKPGDVVDVGTPEGRFTPALDAASSRAYLLIAAGSGITPTISIAKTILREEPLSRVALIYANKTVDSIVFREDVEDLKNAHMTRFSVAHVLSRERQDTDLLDGRLDRAKLEGFARALFEPAGLHGVYLCGPLDMIDMAKSALTDLGVAPAAIHTELFVVPGAAKTARPKAAEAKRAGASRVTVIRDGIRQVFDVPFDGPSIVDAGLARGLEIPHSCKGGVCSTCRCLKRAGEVRMDANYALEPWELEKGFVLACQSHPVSDELVLDFDEA